MKKYLKAVVTDPIIFLCAVCAIWMVVCAVLDFGVDWPSFWVAVFLAAMNVASAAISAKFKVEREARP